MTNDAIFMINRLVYCLYRRKCELTDKLRLILQAMYEFCSMLLIIYYKECFNNNKEILTHFALFGYFSIQFYVL